MAVDEDYYKRVTFLLDQEFKKYITSNPENVEDAANSLLDDLIEDATMALVFEADIQRKLPIADTEAGSSCQAEYVIPDTAADIFGNGDKNFECCVCPNCNRSIASSRFAPHLVKCMGMGRNSSRIARTRIATNANKDSGGTSSCAVTDDEDDADWSVVAEKKGKKKKEKSTSSKKVKHKIKSGSSNSEPRDSSSCAICYDGMSERDRRALLSQICGVISEHTKKVCTKSTRCPLHTDDQKKALRDLYLSEAFDTCLENIQIDVDTCEEEGEITKESLARSWEAENSNTSSPADSASTSSTSSSKKREKAHKLKNKD